MRDGMTYGEYLRVPDLLSLQRGASDGGEHDEHLFVVIHQVYELWFAQMLVELDAAHRHLDADDVARTRHTLGRIRSILKVIVAQLDVLETMTPLEFLSFRDLLGTASGFESIQFRMLEFTLGMRDRAHLDRFGDDPAFDRLRQRHDAPSTWDHVVGLLQRRGVLADGVPDDEAVADALLTAYREEPDLAGLLEGLTDVDEGLMEWRYRHVMMVQRTLGVKMGSGGSSGAGYLRGTLFRPVFPLLWAIRSRF